jgi:5-methylcytosine-specific restriction protein B
MSPALYESLFGRAGPRTLATAPIDPRFADIAAMLSSKGRVILYGPPGTGKTYHARRFSVAWLLEQNDRAAEALDVLSDIKRFAREEAALAPAPAGDEVAAQLTRQTFHPSYSYEDFIEGFRPVAR